jgi:hypothetical protein
MMDIYPRASNFISKLYYNIRQYKSSIFKLKALELKLELFSKNLFTFL